VAKEKQNIQELTVPEVEEKIRTMKQEIFTLRFRNAMRQLDNPLRIRFLRRDIARYTTALAEHRQGIRFLATGLDLPPGADAPRAAKPKAAKKTSAKAASPKTPSPKTAAPKTASPKTAALKTAAAESAPAGAKPAAKKTSAKSAAEETGDAKKETGATAAKSSEKPKRRVPWSRGKKKE
jgi:large subunit ribosomal protein L29